jgi:hypothetical protein
MYILYAKINSKKMTITILFLIIKLFSPYGEYLLNKIIIKKLVFFQTFRTQMFQSVLFNQSSYTMLHWRDLISDVASCSWLMKTLRPKRIKLKEDSDFFKIISILFLSSRHKFISIYKSYSWESTRTVERKNTKVINIYIKHSKKV